MKFGPKYVEWILDNDEIPRLVDEDFIVPISRYFKNTSAVPYYSQINKYLAKCHTIKNYKGRLIYP